MGTSCAVLVAVAVVSVVMATCGVGRYSSDYEEPESSSCDFKLNYREILMPILSDYSASDIFLSVLHMI